jgi:hypothetical protein
LEGFHIILPYAVMHFQLEAKLQSQLEHALVGGGIMLRAVYCCRESFVDCRFGENDQVV